MSSISGSSPARVAIGGILHETHTFMEGKTTLADFAAQSLHYGEDLLSSMRHLAQRHRRDDRPCA